MTEDLEIEQLEQLAESLGSSDYGSPKQKNKDSTLKFFRELILSKDSRKFANLQKDEIGRVALSVRSYLDIARYAEAEGLEEVSDYLKASAEDILATSLSFKGFLAKLFVTEIKKEQKVKEEPKKKIGIFSRGDKDE